MIYLITKFEDEISKINLENMLWDTLAQKWRKIFLNILAAWLKASPSLKSNLWKITSFGERLRDCWQTICATYCRILFPFFPRAVNPPPPPPPNSKHHHNNSICHKIYPYQQGTFLYPDANVCYWYGLKCNDKGKISVISFGEFSHITFL